MYLNSMTISLGFPLVFPVFGVARRTKRARALAPSVLGRRGSLSARSMWSVLASG
ncbi:predicted protein [Plenodomus lingam JN3]|uniref:Predicted protein n=1 Tax=Leptosphaeria maculans (strain JN3 / isolate v23.1.3 / race Av1-4-5-6-7-8) TaxID=985895 RepID=E5A1J8_LEPMJ|nr:predicted protein [Plenodomus lingam JN3]CBX97462.1 predicted protein [Plenodomus lingam JN3]